MRPPHESSLVPSGVASDTFTALATVDVLTDTRTALWNTRLLRRHGVLPGLVPSEESFVMGT